MQFFKHYNNARTTEIIREFMKIEGKAGYFYYMVLLEVLCKAFDGDGENILVHVDDLMKGLEIKHKRKLDQFLANLNQISDKIWVNFGKKSIKFLKNSENIYFFEAPILVELKDRDFKKARKECDSSAENTRLRIKENKELKNKEKEINKEKICSFQNLENSISFTEVTNLFNQKLPKEFSNKGRVKHAPYFANNTILEKFDQILGHTDFKGPEGWLKLFDEVLKSDFLMGISEKNFVVTLDWLLDTSNIRKVLGGQYTNGKDFAAQESSARLNKMIDEYHASKAAEND